MPIFVSYARDDRVVVDQLRRDLHKAHNVVWLDDELTGGETWWETILGQIRQCDVFIFALSPHSLRSRACKAELDYAIALRRPLLPVMVADAPIQAARPEVSNAQIVDFRVRSTDSVIDLLGAVARQPKAPPLPDPLPQPPVTPLSYMNQYRDLLDQDSLTYSEQAHLLLDLKEHLDDDDDLVTALQFIWELRQRNDVAAKIVKDVDLVLARYPQQMAPIVQRGRNAAEQGQQNTPPAPAQQRPADNGTRQQSYPNQQYSPPGQQQRPATVGGVGYPTGPANQVRYPPPNQGAQPRYPAPGQPNLRPTQQPNQQAVPQQRMGPNQGPRFPAPAPGQRIQLAPNQLPAQPRPMPPPKQSNGTLRAILWSAGILFALFIGYIFLLALASG
ncbi:hypothetical protein GCM10009841_06920 [Microlunatus panaciterrae]|uniref:TIR domain-containing protein n=1 Tax=Microlunatus panaciterrae TaxID=400768 RepID=A0ABS2RI27_9ACTN|nr:toll/interleukin-1 receptor domain-containing protein [Microlunatus panaciterrae]MBM7798655.1 hypothetical protein [Microlunatus panaciterrae]